MYNINCAIDRKNIIVLVVVVHGYDLWQFGVCTYTDLLRAHLID